MPRLVALLCCLAAAASALAAGNLLKNGSFEGGKRYWFQCEDRQIVKDAAHGEYSLRIEKGGIQSAALMLQPGKAVTISFSAKADADTTVGWQCTPASREVGQQHKQAWGMKGRNPVKITTQWKRYSFKFTPTAAQTGLWPKPTYMMQFGDGDKPWLIDGITISYDGGEDAYIPRREVEVLVDCPDLKGYKDVSANLVPKGSSVTLIASASNSGSAEREVTLRWQFADYEGERVIGAPVEKKVKLAPGRTLAESMQLKLPGTGLLLGRVAAIGADGKVIDSSDIPVCSLPYEKNSTKPDPRERFGASVWGKHHGQMLQRIGMAWTRWYPHMNWADHQKDGPDKWRWFDPELDILESLGISTHAVLYGKPKWAFASDKEQLPKDMQWPADDPRWEDLSVQTAWDKFIVEAVKHYKGRHLVYEIENEPELDHWDKIKDQYAKFTIRTARLIKQTDPAAKVMVDNVYGVPSGLNRHLLEKGGGKFIDIISWHDYHEGWLADHVAIRRMRNNLEALSCGHIEIWFNEGWAYTNTIVDEPAVALTNLNSAQSTNAMVACVAELTANGQEKTILFHTGYETHGMSFWDYYGPGTMLWDFYGYPMPLVPAWNTLCHHIGLSKAVGFVRPESANFCIFQDERNARGVMVAYADRDAKGDVTVELPIDGLIVEDAMGNPEPMSGNKLVLSKSGRPVFLYSADKTAGKLFLEKLTPLDRKNASFVSARGGAGGTVYRLPRSWEGTEKGSAANNPVKAGDVPLWRVDQVWPDNPTISANYIPLRWTGTAWFPDKNHAGGQPEARVENGSIRIGACGSWTGREGQRIAGLVFIAPKSGMYRLTATARTKPWEGKAKAFKLAILKKDTQRATVEKTYELPRDATKVPIDLTIELTAGHELVILPMVPDWHNATGTTIEDVAIEALP